MPVGIVIVGAILTPRLAPRDQFELLTECRMKRMGYSETLRLTARFGCSW
jgi:hypothetical protein